MKKLTKVALAAMAFAFVMALVGCGNSTGPKGDVHNTIFIQNVRWNRDLTVTISSGYLGFIKEDSVVGRTLADSSIHSDCLSFDTPAGDTVLVFAQTVRTDSYYGYGTVEAQDAQWYVPAQFPHVEVIATAQDVTPGVPIKMLASLHTLCK